MDDFWTSEAEDVFAIADSIEATSTKALTLASEQDTHPEDHQSKRRRVDHQDASKAVGACPVCGDPVPQSSLEAHMAQVDNQLFLHELTEISQCFAVSDDFEDDW